MPNDQMADNRWVGERVMFSFDRHWSEEGTVTAESEGLLTIVLDETLELPDHIGGGWCCEVQRETAEVEVIR